MRPLPWADTQVRPCPLARFTHPIRQVGSLPPDSRTLADSYPISRKRHAFCITPHATNREDADVGRADAVMAPPRQCKATIALDSSLPNSSTGELESDGGPIDQLHSSNPYALSRKGLAETSTLFGGPSVAPFLYLKECVRELRKEAAATSPRNLRRPSAEAESELWTVADCRGGNG